MLGAEAVFSFGMVGCVSDEPWLSAAQEGRKMDAGVWFHRTVAVFPSPETTEAEKRLKRPHGKSLKLLYSHRTGSKGRTKSSWFQISFREGRN